MKMKTFAYRVCVLPVVSVAAAFVVRAETVSPLILFTAMTGNPDGAEVEEMFSRSQEAGFGQMMLYPRSGLECEYMGEGWLKLVGRCLEAGKRRGMKVWLYDEYNWPSGTCKGRVPAENPEWLYAEYAVWKNPDGTFRWEIRRNDSFSMHAKYFDVNAYSPEAIRRFMELTHDVYEKRFASYFADGTIPGIFTDEPAHPSPMKWDGDKPIVHFRWYRELEDQYRERTGRDFRTDVEQALRDPSKGEVWEIYTELKGLQFRKAFFDPIAAWAKRLGIESSGHLISEGQARAACNYNGLPLNTLRGLTMPCIDRIRDRLQRNDDEWLTCATGQYAIEHNSTPGKDTLDAHGGIELFALGPCDLSIAQLSQRIWTAALYGIDKYLLSLYHTSARGFREKGGWAMFVSPAQPWFAHCRDLHDSARKAAEWSRKRFVRDVAVRYPQRIMGRLAVHSDSGEPVPKLTELVKAFAWEQISFELLQDDEKSELPYVFSFEKKSIVEERSGRKFSDPDEAMAWLRAERPDAWRATDASGKIVPGLLLRRYADGTAVVLNMTEQTFSGLRLVKGCAGTETFSLPPCGVWLHGPGGSSWRPKSEAAPFTAGKWTLERDRDVLKRVWFSSNGVARIEVKHPIEGARWVVRTDPACRVKIDGKPLAAERPAGSVPYGYAPMYSETAPMNVAPGVHELVLEEGLDNNMFLPALWLSGNFMTDGDGVIVPPKTATDGPAPLSMAGLADFAGTATYRTETDVPGGKGLFLELDTGGLAARVRLGGADLGEKALPPFEWKIPDALAGSRQTLEVLLTTSVRPVFGRDDVPGVCLGQRLWTHTQRNAARSGLLSLRWLREAPVPSGAHEFEVHRPDGGRSVQAADFGVMPSSPDNVRALNRALAFCRTNGVGRLVFGKGTYRFTADAPILLNGMTNFVFDGAGADFVFLRNKGSSFHAAKCERLEMRDFSVDWDWEKDPLASIAQVVSSGDSHIDFRFVHYPKFPRSDVKVAFASPWDAERCAPGVDGEGPGRGFDMAWDGNRKGNTRTQWISSDVLRVFPGRKGAELRKGGLYRVQHYYYHMGGFVFVRCGDVGLCGIEVKSTPGHAFLVSGGERFHLKNVNVRPPGGEPRRVISSTADHFHVARSRGRIKLEGCEFARGGDDCVNVRDGTAYSPGLTDAHTVRTVRGKADRLFAPGDRVELLRADYVPTGFSAPVREVRAVNAAKQIYDVVFGGRVPPPVGDGYVLLNREYGSGNIILRDCFFHDNRARGVVLQASDATIERCRFVRNESCAMKITTGWTLKLWCEGYGATNIVVRDCVFDRANGANRDSQDIYFGTYRKEPSAARRDACETPVFRDILFENNRFVDSFGLTAFVGSCGNIVFRGNSFENPSKALVARPERGAFRICASKDVFFDSNVWKPSPYAPKAGMLLECASAADVP